MNNKLDIKNGTPTIAFLRRAGWKVRVIHKRPTLDIDAFSGIRVEYSPKGGETRIEITSPDQKIDAFGIAYCADEDHFNRKLGNKIALGRAWKNAIQMEEQIMKYHGYLPV